MAKYIDADLLIRKIKGQIRSEELNFAALGGGGQTLCINTLKWVLKQIDFLQQEQPSKDLEEAADEYADDNLVQWEEDGEIYSDADKIRETFIAGAEWMAKRMPMPEDTVIFQKGVAEGKRLMMEDAIDAPLYRDGDFLAIDLDMGKLGHEDNDKVKLIILKEEEL